MDTSQNIVDTEKSSSSSKLWSDIAAYPDNLSREVQYNVVGSKKRKVKEVKKGKFELRFIRRESGKVVPALGRIDENDMLVSFLLSDEELMEILSKEPDRRKRKKLLMDTLKRILTFIFGLSTMILNYSISV